MRKSVAPIYAIYLRCSTDDQAEGDFTTIDAQRTVCRDYVRARGADPVVEYSDEGISGTTLKRPGWKKLLADAEARRFNVLVCTYMSRLGRDDAGTVAEWQLRELGVSVQFARETFRTVIEKHATRLVDAAYVDQVRQWTRTKMERMVAEGYYCGGTIPFGFDVVPESDRPGAPKRLQPNSEEAPLVSAAFDAFLATGKIAPVAKYLEAVTGKPWRVCNVRYLLENERYCGALTFGDWRNEDAIEPIVSREIWNAAQDLLQKRARATTREYSTRKRGRR